MGNGGSRHRRNQYPQYQQYPYQPQYQQPLPYQQPPPYQQQPQYQQPPQPPHYTQQPQHHHAQHSYEDNTRSPDPYAGPAHANEHAPRIVVHSTPYMDQPDHYEVKQRPPMRCQQQQQPIYSPPKQISPTPCASRTAFDCQHSTKMSAQRATQTSPPPTLRPPPMRHPVASCTCKSCGQKEEPMATYAAVPSAANTTYVAQNHCPQSTSVATRTAVPANTSTSCTGCSADRAVAASLPPQPPPQPQQQGMCTGCSADRAVAASPSPSPPPQPQRQGMCNTMGYTSQQQMAVERVVTTRTCGAANCRGHEVYTPLEHSVSTSTQPQAQQSSRFGFRSPSRMPKDSISKQNMMQAQSSPSYYDGISASGSAPSDVISEFHQECLEAHNRCRARHQNCPQLTLSSELCQYAQQWAKHLASTGRLEHRQVHTYGENLYTSRGMAVNGSTAVQSWYDEIRYYDFSKPNYKPGTGHFTQVVWRDSRQLGVGVVTKGDTTYVVCNYNPPGNIIGSFDSMVPQLK